MNRINRNKIEPRQEYRAQHLGEDSSKLIIITSGARGCWLVTLLYGLFCNHENTEVGVNTQELKTIDLPQVAPFIKHRIRSGWVPVTRFPEQWNPRNSELIFTYFMYFRLQNLSHVCPAPCSIFTDPDPNHDLCKAALSQPSTLILTLCHNTDKA